MNREQVERIQEKMQACQQTKCSVNSITEYFLCYVTLCLEHEEFIKGINALLPLGKFTQIRQRNAYDHSLVDNMGIVIERMEVDSSAFSLCVSIELTEGRYNQALNATIPVSTCRTIEELKKYVQTDDFARQVKQKFEEQVEISFSQNPL